MFCGVPQRVRRRAQHPHCPVLPRASRARCRSPTARRSRWIIKIGLALDCRDRAALDVPPEELLLSGHAEELPDQPVRPADLRRRPPRHRARRRRRSASASRASTWRRTPARPRTAAASGRIHEADYALVDYNRAGVPLVEMRERARHPQRPRRPPRTCRELRAILESLGVSDVKMEEGSLRVRRERVACARAGTDAFGTKVEIKNMNSIRSLERAVELRDRTAERGARGR